MERKQNMSSPSPVTDGQHVWVMTGVGVLKAFDFAGKEIWTRNIQTDYGRFGLNWGYASSPLLQRQRALRAGAARHEDRRPVVRPEDRQDDRQDALARRAADRRRAASRRTPTRRPRGSRPTAAPNWSSPAATSSPATIRRPAASTGAPTS